MKIAFVVQRYGHEVNGGAELHCRQVAERLVQYADVDVITTCAIDYITWKNEYTPGVETLNGVTIRRFPVDHERTMERFNTISDFVFNHPHSYEDEIEWMKEQGPYSTQLFDFLSENKKNYDIFIFFTYLYCTTFFGLPLVADRAILVPTAHDEPPIYLNLFQNVFNKPQAILFNTEEERLFVNSKYTFQNMPQDVVGVGIEIPPAIDPAGFMQKHTLNNFIVYVGRIDENKGCRELFDYFLRYKQETNDPVQLVLMGRSIMDIPDHRDIVSLGFVSEQEKFDGIAASKILVMPSRYESLSMVLLEAWKCRRPVLVYGGCEVLRGQCRRSNAGLWYENYLEFEECLSLLLKNPSLQEAMGSAGSRFVDMNYSWEVIIKKYLTAIGGVMNSKVDE